jgi:branched-chain amino acid transport system substrate-binding protein
MDILPLSADRLVVYGAASERTGDERMARSIGISRRRLLANAAGGSVVLASALAAPKLLAQTKKPIRLGVINSFTGASAYTAQHNLDAMSLYFDSIGWTVAGRKIEIVKEDDQFTPQIGLQKARKLVESDQVDMITGVQGSSVALAVLNYAKQKRVFYVISGAGTDAITWQRNPYVFRTSLSSWQLSKPMADWAYDNLAKEMLLTASDYAGGRDVLAEFRAPYTKKGGKIIKEVYPPLGTTDFSAYLTDIRQINPPATYDFLPGTDRVRFIEQYPDMGMLEKIPICGFEMIDSQAVETLGKKALGVLSTTTYVDTVDNPESRKFAADYHKKFGAYPDVFSDYGFVAAVAIAEALKATDGDTSNKDKLAEAMVKVKFNAPRGPFSFDPVTHNPINNVYICKCVELKDGRVANEVVATFKGVRDPGSKQY